MCTDKINFYKHSLVSQTREEQKKNNPVFYEQKTVIVSKYIKIKLFYNLSLRDKRPS